MISARNWDLKYLFKFSVNRKNMETLFRNLYHYMVSSIHSSPEISSFFFFFLKEDSDVYTLERKKT